MGLGRRDFLKLFSTALLAVVSQPISKAITILDDTYVNRRLGIAFQKPSGWYFNDIKEMGEIVNGEILDLIDAQSARKIITETEMPFVSISQTPLSIDDPFFTPGVNVYLDIRSSAGIEELENKKWELLLGQMKEPYRTIKKDILSNTYLLKNFKVLSKETPLQISNCQAIRYSSSFLYQHIKLSEPVKVRMLTLLIIQNDFWYTFRMYDAPKSGKGF